MKTNIVEVNYFTKIPESGTGWFTWVESCDECNVVIFSFGEKMVLTSNIDQIVKEKDFCINCLGKKLQ